MLHKMSINNIYHENLGKECILVCALLSCACERRENISNHVLSSNSEVRGMHH